MPSTPRESRLAYYRDLVGVLEAEGIAWANWEYKGDFGIYEWLGVPELCGEPDTQMIDALIQKR
jgi:endoglucanase